MSNKQLSEFEKLMEEKAGLKGLSEFEDMMKSLMIEPLEKPKPKIDISNKIFEAFKLKKVEPDQEILIQEPIVEEIIEEETVEEDTNDLINHAASLIQPHKKEEELELIREQLSQAESERIDKLEKWVSRIANAGPGSGETRLLRLDDLDTTNLADNKFLKYNSSAGKFQFTDGTAGGSKHVIQKNDLEDGSDSTTSLNAKTNLLFDSNTFRVTNDAGSDSTQIRLTTEFTGITNGTAAANKALILGSNRTIDNIGAMTSVDSVTSTGTVTGNKLTSTGTGAASIETAGGITLSGQLIGVTTLNAHDIDIQDTNAEAVAILHRNETGSNGNDLGKLKFKGQNSADEETNFAQIGGKQKTVTNGSEDGEIEFNVQNGGTLQTSMRLDEDGIDIPGSRTIKFGGSDAFRIMTTQSSSSVATSSTNSDGRIKIEIDGTEYYIPIYNV